MKKKRILLLGSSGFIGSRVKKILKRKYKIFAPPSRHLNLLKKKQIANYLSKKKIEVIINCAWIVNSKIEPIYLRNVNKKLNITMAKNLIEAAINKKIQYFLNISSINLYKPKKKKLFEKDLFITKNISKHPESLSKLIFIKLFNKISNKFFYLNLILSNVYGFKKRDNSNLLLDKIFKNIFLKKKNIVYFSKKNKTKINLLYIDDAVNAIVFFLKKLIKKKLHHNSINICSKKNYALRFVINKIQNITKTKIKFNNQNNNNLSILPSGLLAKKYGWQNKTSIDKGIENTISHYKRIKKIV